MRTKKHWINVYLNGAVQDLCVTDAEERRIYKAKMKEIEAREKAQNKHLSKSRTA